MKTIVVTSGGFDPVHSGHLYMFEQAAEMGDKLIVGLNSDDWLTRKKGRAFMPFSERKAIVGSMKVVDEVIGFDDADDTACDLLRNVQLKYPDANIIFANGGDRTKENIPEMAMPEIEFVFGVGGENKANSSSWILESWQKQRTVTRWGHFDVLENTDDTCKVKELVIKPGGALSYQKHAHRSELWFVKSGYGKLILNEYSDTIDHDKDTITVLNKSGMIVIGTETWHQVINDSKTDSLRIVEIQYGSKCLEEDIVSE